MSRKKKPHFKITLVGLSVQDALQLLRDIETSISKQKQALDFDNPAGRYIS